MRIAVVIPSCDKYGDLWDPFFTLLFRYWPDCPFPVYLGSNHATCAHPRVIPVQTGDDRGWADNLSVMLETISASYILLLLEDYFIDRPVATSRILALADSMEKSQAACVRLFPSPGPDRPCSDDPTIGEIKKGSAYRVSLQAALWNTGVLQQLLRAGESPWMFEVYGSRRSDDLSAPFLSVVRDSRPPPISYFCTAVVRGKWHPRLARFCKQEGISVNVEARPRQAWYERHQQRLVRPSLVALLKKLLSVRDHSRTRRSPIPIVARLSIRPDRVLVKGPWAGTGCYYKTALLNVLVRLRPRVCLEIGTHYGGTAAVFEEYFKNFRPDGVLITADIVKYTNLSSRRVRQVLVYPHTPDVVHHHRVSWSHMLPDAREQHDSVHANAAILTRELQRIGASAFDLCFIDGDHTEISFVRDMQIAERLSTPPHYMVLDDVKDELHESSRVYRSHVIPEWNHYEFDDWPIFAGVALIWSVLSEE